MMRANGAAARQTRVKMAELRAWAVVLSSSGGKTFYRVISGEKNLNCSALILSHLVLHLLPSPDPLFSKISRYQDSGKHCPEMTILIAHASVNFTLFTIHIRLVGNMKRGGSKWASGSRTRGNHGLTGTAMSSGFKQLSAQPSTCFVFFVVVCCCLYFVVCVVFRDVLGLQTAGNARHTRQLYVCGALHTVH